MTTVVELETLASAHRPSQFGLLEKLVALFTGSGAVTDLAVRGSLATGSADRLSDVDLVVGVEDPSLPTMVTAQDTLLQVELGSVLPGWRDRLVGDLGGVGFVHLVPWDGRLQQVDVYFVAASAVGRTCSRTGARTVLRRAPTQPCTPTTIPTAATDPLSLVVEALVLGYLIRKRIARGDAFVAYAEAGMLAGTAKDLIKITLAPASRHWGWYRLHEEIGVTPIGRNCLADLHDIITGPAVPTSASLDRALGLVMRIAHRVSPEALAAVRPVIATYWPNVEFA